MSDMKTVRLAEVLSIEKGKKIMPSASPTAIRYIQIEDLRGEANMKWAAEEQQVVACDENDVLLAWDGANAGEFGYGLKGAVGSTLAKLSPLNGSTHTPYLGHFLKSMTPYLRSKCTGATIPHVNRRVLEDIEIPLPPLPTQRRIAAVLDKAQALVANDRQTLALYDQLAKSLFLEMFGDPVKNERGWGVKPFDELVAEDCPLSYGIVQPGVEVEGGIPIVRPVDLDRRVLTAAGLKRIAPKIAAQYSRTELRGDELLLSVRASIGLMAFATPELAGANVSRGVVPIWLRESEATREFIFGLFENASFHQQLGTVVKGATLKGLNLKDLRSYLVVAPPIELQRQFSSRMESTLAQRAQAEQSLRQSEGLFGSLLQAAFRGELESKA